MIFYHADDYGMNLKQSKHILECADRGCLNSISIFANSPCLGECMELLNTSSYGERIVRRCWHVNLLEGHCCSNPSDVPLLADHSGIYRLSFMKLLFRSLLPGRKKLLEEIKVELSHQLDIVSPYLFQNGNLSVDGHQHVQMVPLVMRAIDELLSDREIELDYFRIANEPILPYLKVPSLYFSYPLVNVIKNVVLKTLTLFTVRLRAKRSYRQTIFWGLLMSGDMNFKRVNRLKPYFSALAYKKEKPLEILFHPGGADTAGNCLSPVQQNFVHFYLSEGRNDEYQALCQLREESEK